MSISIGQAFQDLQKTPQKWMTLMWLCLCQLIPVVGPMVLVGYLFRRFARERVLGVEAEDFVVDDFLDYLWAGLYPTLVAMVGALVLMPVMFIVMVAMMAIIMAGGASGSEALMVVGTILTFVVMVVFIALMYVILMPMELRAGLRQNFGEGFSMSFVKSFLAKEGGSLALWYFILILIAIPAGMLGYCALFIGMYVVSAVFYFVSMHILFQHYDQFLAKGGEPIPVSPELLYGKSQVEAGNIPQPPPPADSGP